MLAMAMIALFAAATAPVQEEIQDLEDQSIEILSLEEMNTDELVLNDEEQVLEETLLLEEEENEASEEESLPLNF